MKWSFYRRYAFRSLRRNGQRTLLAVICVAFGVMSLLSMWLLATIIRDAVIMEPRISLGGDAQLSSFDGTEASLATELAQLRLDGIIDQATVVSQQWGLTIKSEREPAYVLNRALGVDPQTYPLIGTFRFRDNRTLAETLQQPGDVVVSRDVANQAQVAIGDRVLVGWQGRGVPVRLRIAGIAEAMPDRRGATAIYTLATAQQLLGTTDVFNLALVTWGPRGAALETASCSNGQLAGFAGTASEQIVCANGDRLASATKLSADNQRIVDVFDTMLKGAGLLGLLVGGIGVANTLHVLLTRRTGEIAILKTLGYTRRDIVSLIGVETAVLGLVGSVLGLLAALGASFAFTLLLENIGGSLMATWRIEPLAVAGAMAAGTLTALLFGVVTSIRASAVRPAALLRNQVELPRSTRLATVGIWLLLGLAFVLLSSSILGSLLLGAGVVAVAVGGFVVLGGVLSGALALLVHIPLGTRNMVSLAQHNLRRQGLRSVFALVALWAGIFAIGFATATVVSAQQRVAGQAIELSGDNLLVQGRASDVASIEQQTRQHNVDGLRSQLLLPVEAKRMDGTPLPFEGVMGRNTIDGDLYIESGSAWNTTVGVYVHTNWLDSETPVRVGEDITLSAAGNTLTLPILGTFASSDESNAPLRLAERPLLLSAATVQTLGGDGAAVQVIAQVPLTALQQVGAALHSALPDALVVTSADLNAAETRLFANLFVFVAAIAGLALLAGAVLIANSVGLALVERRRELGILKAVGYSSGRVLQTLAIEHAVLGLLGGVAGVLSVFIAIAVVNQLEVAARLAFDLLPALLLVGVAVALAVGSALLVAWQPTLVRPLVVLREE